MTKKISVTIAGATCTGRTSLLTALHGFLIAHGADVVLTESVTKEGDFGLPGKGFANLKGVEVTLIDVQLAREYPELKVVPL
jgi:hypothetical protein